MTTRLSKASKALAGVLLFVLALRAVAGPALCELYGEHQVPSGPAQAIESLAHEGHAVVPHEHRHMPDQHPAGERSEHACEDPVYLTGEAASASSVEWTKQHGKAVWSYAPAAVVQPASVAVRVSSRWATPPPPSITPLELTRRLRI